MRVLLDYDSPQMTAHYARLHDKTVRRHWEQARKVNIKGEAITLDPDGPLAEVAWAKQRVGRATQALPNGYCGLPVQQSCPHANACLTCPMFLTTPQFLPQHREHRHQVLQLITAAEARGQARLVEFDAVAREAGVSRSWLYAQPGLRTEIERLRARHHPADRRPVPERQRASEASLHQRLELATHRIRELETDNKRLRHALAEALGERRAAPTREPRPDTPRPRTSKVGPC